MRRTTDLGGGNPRGRRETRPADAGYVEPQRQINEFLSDLLDEREQRTGRQLEANGAVLVALGIVIAAGGLWFYARFRAIATEASIGAAAARRYVLVPPRLPPGPLGFESRPAKLSSRSPFSSSQGWKPNPARR